MRRRLLMVGRSRYSLPLSEPLQRKFDALERDLEVRVLATDGGGNGADPRFRLVRPLPLGRLEGPSFYALLPFRVARELRTFAPDVVLAQGAQETSLVLLGRMLARSRAKVVLDVHGDWRAPTRLYGSRWRRALAPLGDVLARISLRKADGVRTISSYTSGLVRAQGVEPAAVFPAFMDLDPFLASAPAPLPSPPVALFVGVLERYKAVDVLADAWRRVSSMLSDVELHIVGRGPLQSVVERLVAESGGRVSWTPTLAGDEIAGALDAASILVLPSRSEGLGRVVVEAFCRGRAVVGSRAGGIPDLVADGENGLLVAAEDPDALAGALVRALSEPRLAERLGAAARRAIEPWLASPDDYAAAMRELVERVAAS
jgi:glycosyltransferase involved in cell wall biosynthesis